MAGPEHRLSFDNILGLWLRRDVRDVVLAGAVSVVAAGIMVTLDVFDGLVILLQRYEDFELDEIFLSSLVVLMALGWLSWRRWGDFRREERVRLQRETELRVMKDRFESILMAAEEGILGLDQAGRIVFCNPAAARLVGWEMKEMLGHTHREALYQEPLRPSASDAEDCPFLEPLEQGVIHLKRDEIFWRKDGACFPAEFALSARRQAEEGSVLVFRDVTERVRTEWELSKKSHALAASNGELQSFVSVVSHDLREPLRSVGAYLQLLERRATERLTDEEKEYIGFAVDGAQRMDRMIRDLAEFSRLETHGKEFGTVDGDAVANAAIMNLEAAIREAGASVVFETPLPEIVGDESQLVRTFQNLIANGIKYRDPGRSPEIRLRADRQGGAWVFAVADNGIGIDSRYLDRIFGIFQRLHSREEYEGSGVGLAVVKRIVERHGGRVWVDSEPGRGSTFFFSLKVAAGIASVAA